MSMSHDSVVKEVSKKYVSVYSFSKTYPAFIVLILALIASVVVWRVITDKVAADKSLAFEKATSSVVTRLNTAVNNHMQIIQSMQGLYETFPFVVRDVFELYGSIPVKTYPSIQVVAFAPPVPRRELGAFVYFAQSERYYTYSITPKDTMSMYYPVFYTVPLEQNQELVGFNLASDSIAIETIERAKESKGIVSSPMLVLPGNESRSFLLMSAVEKHDVDTVNVRGDNVSGILLVRVLVDEFFKEAIGTGVATDTSIVFSCFDVSESGEEKMFSSANSATVPHNYTPAFEQEETVRVADRKFIVRFATVPEFGAGVQNNLPMLTLGGGLVSSFLLFAFTFSLLTSRARAQDIAERMTRSQRRIVDSSRDLIGITSLAGEVRAMNPAVFTILGYDPEEIVGRNLYDFMLPEDGEGVRTLIKSATDEQQLAYEVRMVSKDGKTRWVNWNDTVSLTDGLVYSIGRDITERKASEEEIKLKSRQVDLARQYAAESEKFKTEFMSQASFYFRTSLTSIIGYLQLVLTKIYSTPEEMDGYVETAYNSSEDLLSRVGDLLDVAEGENIESAAATAVSNLPLQATFADIFHAIQHEQKRGIEVVYENAEEYQVHSNKELLQQTLSDVIAALGNSKSGETVQVSLQVNPYENVVEVQVLAPAHPQIEELITLLKKATTHSEIMEALRHDKDDVLFRIATSMSRMKMIDGRMVVETLGSDGNVVILTLPVRKIPSLAYLKKKK